MEQLVSTPITPLELMVGRLVPYFMIRLLDRVLCATLAIRWFEVHFREQWTVLVLSCTLFLVVVLVLGYVVSVPAKTQLAASQAAMIATFLLASTMLEQSTPGIEWSPKPNREASHGRSYRIVRRLDGGVT